MSNSRPQNKTVGKVRYYYYQIQFPDGEQWGKSIPFVHALDFDLQNTSFGKIPELNSKIRKTGECHWKDQNGVEHLVRVEDEPRKDTWGKKRAPYLIDR